MRVLLDTHAFLWWDRDDVRLSGTVRELISDGGNHVIVSAASIWEVAIKSAKGRIDLPLDPEPYVEDRLARYRWTTLSVDHRHALRSAALPPVHWDPFDRMLVAQAQIEDLPILTMDPAITRYDVETIW